MPWQEGDEDVAQSAIDGVGEQHTLSTFPTS